MKYFAKITAMYVEKNEAHKAIQQYAINTDSTLLSSETAKFKFINELRGKIEDINHNHKRCIDIVPDIYYAPQSEDMQVTISGNFHMTIFEIKNEI